MGAAALVAGTTIGAGVLALPAATQVRAEHCLNHKASLTVEAPNRTRRLAAGLAGC